MLKPLLLPQLVEERKKRQSLQEGMLDTEMDLSSSAYYTQNSSASDITSPATPTLSMRGALKASGSASSIDTTLHTPAMDSPSSPTFSTVKSGKRALPDVQEEPHERDEDFIMYERSDDDLYDCFCDDRQCGHRDPSMVQSSLQLSRPSGFDYDLNLGFFSEGDDECSPRSKKRRAGESPFAAMATRFGTRFPSFSRKWRLRSSSLTMSIASTGQQESTAPNDASSRSSSLSSFEHSCEARLPPTPTASVFEGHSEQSVVAPVDIQRANRDGGQGEEAMATTPLLPPLMIDASANAKHVPVHSPLQSPSVAEPAEYVPAVSTTPDAVGTPQLPGMPSPPLSTKPSISSFHRSTLNRPGHLTPSSEIPPILIADENDEWAKRLGHANFNVLPEPYVPDIFDIEACRQFRADWDLARCNYTKHLVRTGEHYGVTSKTYKLTEQKWSETDAVWRKNNDITIQNTVNSNGDAFGTLNHATLGDARSAHIMTKIPSLNDPQSQGKFPQLGDEDIVGPMVQAASQLHRSPSKKAKLMKFLAEKFPSTLSRNLP